MKLEKLFIDHPASVNESYLEHMRMSAGFASSLFAAGFCASVHALFPFLFVKTGSRIITRLHTTMVSGRSRESVAGRDAAWQSLSRAQQAFDSAAL